MRREAELATAGGGLQTETVASSGDSEIRAASVEPDELPTVTADATAVDVAVEPGPDVLRLAAQKLLAAAQSPAGPEALGQLEKKARVIEEISSPREITRITTQVRRVMGVQESGDLPNRAADGSAHFDYDHCVVSDSQRIETRDRIEIRETLTDRDNGVVVLSYVRATLPTTGALSYSLVQQVAGGPAERFELTAEEFEEAVERERPYQIIHRFSLVKQIHDEAVIPLLRKFSDQSTSPASRAHSDP